MRRLLSALLLATLAATPVSARDSLGVFGQWGAFRDPQVPRCYAIAAARAARSTGFAAVSSWPQRGVRGQVHFRLSRAVDPGGSVRLVIGGEQFRLTTTGQNAWAADGAGDVAIITAMRAASQMQLSASDRAGRRFTDDYALEGVATAIDAASVACSAR